jgi:hypothetical protein
MVVIALPKPFRIVQVLVGLVGCLATVGCSSGTFPDPNDPKTIGSISIDEVQRRLRNTSDFLNWRKARGEIDDARFAELMSQRANELIDYLDASHPSSDQAWRYAEVMITGRRWDLAQQDLNIALKEPSGEDRRINDTLRMARVTAELGDIPKSIALARSTFNCAPKDAAPILPAVLLEIMPAIGHRGDPADLARLLQDSIAQEEKVAIYPNSVSGKEFLLAKPFHIARAYRLEIPLLLRSGKQDEAIVVGKKYEALEETLGRSTSGDSIRKRQS